MPTSKRDLIKRKHVAIVNALDRSMGWTLELRDQFAEPHPDYAEGYQAILVMLAQAREFTEKMKSFI